MCRTNIGQGRGLEGPYFTSPENEGTRVVGVHTKVATDEHIRYGTDRTGSVEIIVLVTIGDPNSGRRDSNGLCVGKIA